jgi:acyl-CoA dehydrogenase
MSVLTGGVFASGTDDLTDLRTLVDDIGERSFNARIGNRALPDPLDRSAWRHLEEAGLTRLGSTPDSGAGPAEVAVILRGLARHAVTVPLAETDLLAGWLAAKAGLEVPDTGPLTVAVDDEPVPYAAESAAVVFAVRDGEDLRVAVGDPSKLSIAGGHNAGGEPRDRVAARSAPGDFVTLAGARPELIRRGAWARCTQIIGVNGCSSAGRSAHSSLCNTPWPRWPVRWSGPAPPPISRWPPRRTSASTTSGPITPSRWRK